MDACESTGTEWPNAKTDTCANLIDQHIDEAGDLGRVRAKHRGLLTKLGLLQVRVDLLQVREARDGHQRAELLLIVAPHVGRHRVENGGRHEGAVETRGNEKIKTKHKVSTISREIAGIPSTRSVAKNL